MLKVRTLAIALVFLFTACESTKIESVAESDDEAADFGQSALREAMVELAKTPTSAEAYRKFAVRVDELMPYFSRTLKREAELRLSTLAVAPLESGLSLSPEAQMKAFATTVWPTILDFPTLPHETTQDYVKRLCSSEFALDCQNVVPERWPAVLNAKVWRVLKSRVGVALGRCQWCDEDTSFVDLVERSRTNHRRLELVARRAIEGGTPGDWPVAGPYAEPLEDLVVVSFEDDGEVTVGGRSAPGGDWRGEIRSIRGERTTVGLHLTPSRLVAEFIEIVGALRAAGYRNVALTVRHRNFPFELAAYTIDTAIRSAEELDVHNGDTIQILVQALDHQAELRKQ